MTAVPLHEERLLPPPRTPFREVGVWAMLLFIINEASTFIYFIASYFYLGVRNVAWPPQGHEDPKLVLPLIMTVILLSSSVVLYASEQMRKRGRMGMHKLLLTGTIALGAVFLVIQALEYHEKLQKTAPQSSAYDSIFFTITGFHGLHVAVGLIVLLWVLVADVRGRLAVTEPLALKNASLYWHFVDAVWLLILASLYFSPRWY